MALTRPSILRRVGGQGRDLWRRPIPRPAPTRCAGTFPGRSLFPTECRSDPRLPPLRDRLEDIPELARAFLVRAHHEGLPSKNIDGAAMERLQRHVWPGNVRELENLLRRIWRPSMPIVATIERQRRRARNLADAASPNDGEDTPATLSDLVESHLAAYFAGQGGELPPNGLYGRVLAEVEGPLLRLTLAAARGNQIARSREVLGLNRNTLRKRLRDLTTGLKRGAGG